VYKIALNVGEETLRNLLQIQYIYISPTNFVDLSARSYLRINYSEEISTFGERQKFENEETQI